MSIIKQTDKRTGITYAYEVVYRWDKDKKQSRRKCTMIGRVDSETGEIVPTDGRNRTVKKPKEKEPDYKALYEKTVKENEAKDALILALKKEISKLEGRA